MANTKKAPGEERITTDKIPAEAEAAVRESETKAAKSSTKKAAAGDKDPAKKSTAKKASVKKGHRCRRIRKGRRYSQQGRRGRR